MQKSSCLSWCDGVWPYLSGHGHHTHITLPKGQAVISNPMNYIVRKNSTTKNLKGSEPLHHGCELLLRVNKMPSITGTKDILWWGGKREQHNVLQSAIGVPSACLSGLSWRESVLFPYKRRRGLVGIPFWASLLRCSCSCGNSKWSLPCGHTGIGWGSDLCFPI